MSHRPLIQESAPLAGLVTRRDLLRVGSLSIATTAVPASQLLRAARPRKPEKSKSSRADSAPLTRPVTPADVAATMYAGLGINPRRSVEDILQRPRLILERGRPIAELF
ncbi:MAG: hypothetical protein OSB47_16415 [Pirellulaceae bacterium]|nr:hypothetical protein [Pirellulaceae bacterium]